MTALAVPKSSVLGWWHALFAVALGLAFAGVVTAILQSVFADAVGWPDPMDATTTPGVGWPWRVDGAWSLAADIGPALLFGLIFAWGANMVLTAREDTTALRPSVVLTMAALALLTRSTSQFVALSLPVMLAMVIVVRGRAARPRSTLRRSWTAAAVALVACVALTTATVSYGRMNALIADGSQTDDRHVTIPLRGIGNDIVNLISVRVPNAPAGVTVGVWNLPRTSVTYLRGVSIFPGEAAPLVLEIPRHCSPGTVDRLDVRMKVGDREHRQTVRLDAPVELCG